MKAALLFCLAAGVSAKCPAGQKYQLELSTKFCASDDTDKAACASTCCENDAQTCLGINPEPNCSATQFYGKPGFTAAAATAVADCCVTKAVCGDSGYECPAGEIKKADVATLHCPTDVESCGNSQGTCCQTDTNKCGGNVPLACAANYWVPTDSFMNSAAEKLFHESWVKKATTAATAVAVCCIEKATCDLAGYSCAAGSKKKANLVGLACAKDVPSCSLSTSPCCEPDPTKCGALSTNCPPGKYKALDDAWKNITATDADKETKCCADVATCGSLGVVCPAGQTLTPGMGTRRCNGGNATCPVSCCQADIAKCGGLDGIVCAAGFFKPPAGSAGFETWQNKAATDLTKSTACCIKQATCSAFKSASLALIASGTPAMQSPAALMPLALIAVLAAHLTL